MQSKMQKQKQKFFVTKKNVRKKLNTHIGIISLFVTELFRTDIASAHVASSQRHHHLQFFGVLLHLRLHALFILYTTPCPFACVCARVLCTFVRLERDVYILYVCP